ncbi:MAG: acetyl-CoA carboxylase biotin carboxyl carrier protein [bacterium]|jgi:acetyl-CoA carboxylase biotin carboxyl carrier protein|nr:acetyl-CoA carboxylase biotin carboxyl carrier protein [bacterium]
MDYNKIKIIIKDFEQSTLTSLELEFEDVKIKMSKNGPTSAPSLYSAEHSEPKAIESLPTLHKKPKIGFTVKSPLVGTFYASTSPTDQPFVQVGDFVKKGDALCIIEAMKIMNEITSPISGKVVSIHVKNGESIGFDQELVTIDDAK